MILTVYWALNLNMTSYFPLLFEYAETIMTKSAENKSKEEIFWINKELESQILCYFIYT